jgi:hypothetical protein
MGFALPLFADECGIESAHSQDRAPRSVAGPIPLTRLALSILRNGACKWISSITW